MNPAADLAAMVNDWDTVTIAGVDYRGVFNQEAITLEGNVERIPTFLMRTVDATASGVVRDSRVKVNADQRWIVRDLQKHDDGAVTSLVLVDATT